MTEKVDDVELLLGASLVLCEGAADVLKTGVEQHRQVYQPFFDRFGEPVRQFVCDHSRVNRDGIGR